MNHLSQAQQRRLMIRRRGCYPRANYLLDQIIVDGSRIHPSSNDERRYNMISFSFHPLKRMEEEIICNRWKDLADKE